MTLRPDASVPAATCEENIAEEQLPIRCDAAEPNKANQVCARYILRGCVGMRAYHLCDRLCWYLRVICFS